MRPDALAVASLREAAGEAAAPELPRSRDAVVVVPGIMGSELTDATGRILWGLADPRWYVSAWTSGVSLAALRLSDDERAGRYGRIRATRLLRFPAFAPVLRGALPYGALVRGLRSVACHRDAVFEFAYDWRLPVRDNGVLLAEAAARHLQRWRGNAGQETARRRDPDGEIPARLVLVAHSMGGLVVRQACAVAGFAEQVRAVVTLGTPFFGAPKAALLLGSGRGAPLLPRARARRLAVTLPGAHDLLPVYRCVTDGAGARRLTAGDVAGIGGDADLAAASLAWHESVSQVGLPGHVQVAGAHQPTVQAVTFEAGTVMGRGYTYWPLGPGVKRENAAGDGTVPRVSAQLPGPAVTPLAQSHMALATCAEAVLVVQDVLTSRRTGPWLGAGELGLDAADVVAAGREWAVTITGADRAADVTCAVFDVGTGLRVDTPLVGRRDGALVARAGPLPPGLFWVQADGGGASPVRQMVMSADIADPQGEGVPA